jgi:hypothetical protein
MIDELINRLAPGFRGVAVVEYNGEEIAWDEECRGFGRVQWYVCYLASPRDRVAQELMSWFKEEFDRLRSLYDLGVTCEC